jgi:hypothetical protein
VIQAAFFLFVGFSALLAFSNWRLGIYLMIVAGMLQDPVRKMMPGAPGWMVLAFVPIFFGLVAGLFLRGRPWAQFLAVNPALASRIYFFTASLLLAFLVLLVNYGFGAWKVAVIGLITYLFPLIAVAVGFWFLENVNQFRRLIYFYCSAGGVMLIGGLLEHWNLFPGWTALGTDVLGMEWIRHVPGYVVDLTSGFYRSPDILGWHAALTVMFSIVMSLMSRSTIGRVLWLGLIAWGLIILLMSGRNKMIFMPVVFLSVVVLAYMYKGNFSRSFTILLAGVLGVSLFWAINAQIQLDQEYFRYVGQGTADTPDRLKTHGFLSVWSTFQQSGFFGEGLGSASTGARFGGATSIKTWQESGSSKLMVELGVVGFVAVIMLGLVVLRWLLGLLRSMPDHFKDGLFYIGLLGILAANSASFLISHQVFGDPFIVTMTGFFFGLALSAPRWLSVREVGLRHRSNPMERQVAPNPNRPAG